MRFTLFISVPTLVLCGEHDTIEPDYVIYPAEAYKQLGKSVSHWTEDLPHPMRKEMIRLASKDMSVSDYWILQNEFVTQEQAERLCKIMTLRLATFKDVETAAEVLARFREHHCPDCGRFTAWIRKMRGRCTRKDKCTFISLNNGTLGDGNYCDRKRREKKNVTMPYICEHVLREADPFESKRQNATAMYDTNSRYDAKRMITRIHILHPADESGQGRILSWAGAKQECAKFGYELSSPSKDDVDKIGNSLDPKGLYWVARRKEDIKKGLCTVLSAFDTNKLAATDCKGEFRKESDRILGYLCVSHHRKLKPPPKGKQNKFKNLFPVKNDPTSKKSPSINKNRNTKKGPPVGSKPSSKKNTVVNNNASTKKSPSMNKSPASKAVPSVNNKPISKKSLPVNNNSNTKKSPLLGKNPNSKKGSSDNKSSTKKGLSLIKNPSPEKSLLRNNNHKSKTTKKTRQWLLPVFKKFGSLQRKAVLDT
ncbi:unnamed protein product [Cylicocyclus nassatus]|uniref:Uncharacterized protein n=1 Tax=Cylicocyclus nassatus TaxID=53992 RepID=A0AA36HCY1_CYLNA|nr:unnamed protein product [Cylicocyclus nassatus]